MTARLTFFAIVAFWLTMNYMLWRTEFGAHGGDMPVPLGMVWRKILTAPDASSLSVYQAGQHMGYLEFSTSVGQQMANMDEDKVPSEGLAAHAGYQVHFAGNVALYSFTNRLKFDGRVRFSPTRQWQELNLKISTRQAIVEIHSIATNQTIHIKINSDGTLLERNLAFADLHNPRTLIRDFAGSSTDSWLGALNLPILAPATTAQNISWDARRTRVRIGTETMPVYQLETDVLGHTITVNVSTLGEILRIDLPGGISARIDEWSRL